MSNQNWCRIDKTQGLSSAVPQIIKKKNKKLYVVCNGYMALLTIALMPIKSTLFSGVYFSFLQNKNIGFNNFTRPYSSLLTHKNPRKSTERIYADTSLLQTICTDRALRLELTKGTCNRRRTNFARSIVSLDICLKLTKITRDFF